MPRRWWLVVANEHRFVRDMLKQVISQQPDPKMVTEAEESR